ncbi:MAG TPA: alpha/beta fold hydrolase [Gaiellaceae bacterium]|nr:alpha/beta fold hydrolase [Gaiellaceae bacterium]
MPELDLTLADGRNLHVYDDGDPVGFPVVVHNGTPSAGLLYGPHVADAAARRIRLIGYDRAGYGTSDPAPGRSVADVAGDVEQLLDGLGIDRFATWGQSGGGPHALACGALLGSRCAAVATLASVAPFGAQGLDWLAGMGESNLAEFAATLEGADALEPLLVRDAGEMFAGTAAELTEALRSLLSGPDRDAVTSTLGDYLYAAMFRGTGRRVDGWRDDDLAFVRPWGFEPADVGVPVLLLQGEHDLMVPPAHGRWLADHLPDVDARILPDDGHLTLGRRIDEVHAWLHARR